MKKEKNKTGGKPPKPDKATHCIMVRFNSEEFARFLTLYEQSGVYAKAVLSNPVCSGRSSGCSK